jgi:S1-C subfamily serine protease
MLRCLPASCLGFLLDQNELTPATAVRRDQSDGSHSRIAKRWCIHLEGRAPEVRQDYSGTGFICGNNKVLTNHHVAEPWWKNEELGAASQQGLQPTIAEMTAYFPDATTGIPVNILQISEEADLAVLRGDISTLNRPSLRIGGGQEAAISGQPVISLGYATGISAILARAGEDIVKDIVKASGGDPKKIVDELEQRKLIRPLVTQGHIGDILPDKIVTMPKPLPADLVGC